MFSGGFVIPEKLCIFGGKSVGKSTFCRWLSNKLLSLPGNNISDCNAKSKNIKHINSDLNSHLAQILYIDLDPGQTEFTPPGIISIHLISQPIMGPNFTHMRHPEKYDYRLHFIFLKNDLYFLQGCFSWGSKCC